MVVAYNEEKASGIVKDSSGDYELSIGEIGKTNFGCQTIVQSTSVLLACFHKKTYEIKAGDEVVFNGIKCIVKLGKNVDLGEKLYISDGEINFETLEPGTASFVYIFGVMETDDDIVDYYLIFKSTTNVNFNLKTYQQTIKTIDPKYIKDMYYTEIKDVTLPFYSGSLTSTTEFGAEMAMFNPENLFELGEMVMLKIPSKGIDIVAAVKKNEEANIHYIGNISIITGSDDTGEDYFVYSTKDDTQNIGVLVMRTAFSNMEVEINIKKTSEVVYKLDKKYLPNGTATESYVNTAISNAIIKTLNTEV